ncbi:MAG: hypothetical protein K6F93_04410 [Lachnospiraceae bacterium]|nr:hypothetical protein [Lachnospiraceae bacterium]
MYKDEIRNTLFQNKDKRILLYGRPGLGKSCFANELYNEFRGRFIIVNFRRDNVTEILEGLKNCKDITEALVDAYRLSGELLSVTFVLDEFLDLKYENDLKEKITERKDEYKYKDIKIIFIADDVAWAKNKSDLFDKCIKADKISFEEFLIRSGEKFYAQVVNAHMTAKKTMPSLIHNELTDMYYQYLSTGGYIRPVIELTKENPAVMTEDLAAERYEALIGNISVKEKDGTKLQNKIGIINTIPICAKNSRFVFSKTGRRYIGKEQLENNVNELIDDGIIIRIPRLNDDSYSLALTDDGIYRYLLIKNRSELALTDDRIKELVIENHIRNLLKEAGFNVYTWAGKYRFRINTIIESKGKYHPVKVACSGTTRNVNYEEFFSLYKDLTSTKIHITESSFNESKDSINMPVYGCEYIDNFIPQL